MTQHTVKINLAEEKEISKENKQKKTQYSTWPLRKQATQNQTKLSS